MCGPRTPAQHHGEELTPLTDDSLLFDGPRTTYGRVRVLHQIGAGSVGPVFRGEDPASQPVVIKVLRVGLAPERVAIVATALAAARERLAPHPALCAMLDSGIHDAEPFVVSAFVDGDSLDVALREYGPANIVDALPRLRALADALDSAAVAGVTHGGLHLRDIIVSPEHTVLTGIGIASILERVGVRPPVRRPYAAPEITHGHGTSPAGDQFALAAIAHEWLSGRRIAGPGAEGFHLPATSAAGTEAVAAVFCRALDERPDGRYPTATAFVDALGEVADSLAPRVRPPKRRAASAAAPSLAFDFHDDQPAAAEAPALTLGAAADAAAATEVATAPPEVVTPMAPAPDLDHGAADEGPRLSIDLSAVDPVAALEHGGGDHPMADVLASADLDDADGAMAWVPPAPAAAVARDAAAGDASRPESPAHAVVMPVPPELGDDAESALPSGPAAWAVVLVVVTAMAIGGGMALVRWGTPAPVSTTAATPGAAITPAVQPEASTASSPANDPPAAPAPASAAAPAVATPAGPAVTPTPPTAAVRPPATTRPAPPSAPTRAPAAAPKKAVAAAPPPGRLLVRSRPTGAEVFVNGQRRGVTPLAVRDLPLGGYLVRVSRAGFTAAEQRVTLDTGRPSRALEVTLARVSVTAPATAAPAPTTPGTLVVESRPPGARVVIDGRDAGRTPLTLTGVAPGPHAIRIELPGYLPVTTTTRVEPGARARVAVSLTTERPPNP